MQRFRRFLCPLLLLLLPLSVAVADDAAEDRFFDSNGVQIRYTVEGVGNAVVLVHGFTANLDTNWRANGVIDRLKTDFEVIALDMRGHGKSDKPHDPAAYGEEMVDDIVRLLDHLQVERAHVVGYSMGGFVTLKLVTRHPERLLSAVLGGSGWQEPGAQDDNMLRLAESLESGNGVGPLIEALTPAGAPLPTAEQLQMISQMVLATNDPLALAAAIRSFDALQVSQTEIEAIDIPMLAVVGEIDPLRATADRLAEVLPALEVEVLEGKDHMTAVNDPALAESIRDFFARLCNCA